MSKRSTKKRAPEQILRDMHYGIDPVCKQLSINSPVPINITLKRDAVTCPKCKEIIKRKLK